MFKTKISTFLLISLFAFFHTINPAWSTKRDAEDDNLKIEQSKKLRPDTSVLDIVEKMKKQIYISDDLFQQLCLDDLQFYNKTLQHTDDSFDIWVWIILKSNQENYFLSLLEETRQCALKDDFNYIAQFNLGWMYKNGKGIIKDDKKAFEYYLKSAGRGYAPAQNSIGRMYQQGEGIEQDDEKSFEWIFKAAEQGYAPAQYNIGCMYQTGKGTVQSNRKAFEWTLRSAEQGHPSAQYNIGCMYQTGKGTVRSNRKAFEWTLRSAQQGYSPAQDNIGFMYQEGKGVAQDYEKAFMWTLRSAEQGYVTAQHNVGHMYQRGKGVIQNEKEALKWYLKAAEQGYVLAQSALGWVYLQGRGVPRSYSNSTYWLLKAARNEDNTAKEIATWLLKFIFSPYPQEQLSVSKEKERSMEEQHETFKENIQTLLGLHDLETGLNREDSSFRECRIALPSVGKLYKKVVDFEQTCLNLMQSFERPGFMISCIKILDDEVFKELESGSFVKSYTYDSLPYLTFGEKNIQDADVLISILNGFGTPEQRVGFELYRLKSALLEDCMKKGMKAQYKIRHNLAQGNKVRLLEEKILGYNRLISKLETEIESLEELAIIPEILSQILTENVPLRDQKFLDKYPFFKE